MSYTSFVRHMLLLMNLAVMIMPCRQTTFLTHGMLLMIQLHQESEHGVPHLPVMW